MNVLYERGCPWVLYAMREQKIAEEQGLNLLAEKKAITGKK